MKWLWIVLIAILFGSCLTPKKIEKNCEWVKQICIVEKEVIIDTVIELVDFVIIDTIEVPLPQDTAIIEVPVYVTDGMANSERLTVENGLVGATAWVTDNQLNVVAYIADSSLMVNRVDTVTVEREIIKEAESIVVEIIPEWYKFVLYGFIAVVVIVAIVIVVMIKRV